MNEQQAIAILARQVEGDTHLAANALAQYVLESSDYGDPDNSLTIWLEAGEYDGSETSESIAVEWDSDRE